MTFLAECLRVSFIVHSLFFAMKNRVAVVARIRELMQSHAYGVFYLPPRMAMTTTTTTMATRPPVDSVMP